MNFGNVPINQLDTLNLKLPKDPAENAALLRKSTKNGKTKFYVGLAKWGRKEWVGKLYPKGIREANFLDEYAKYFNLVELNATHYKLYKPSDIQKWTEKVQSNKAFKFAPKVYQGISHFGSLKDKQFLTDTFLEGVASFGKYLGPTFLQVSDKFGFKRKDELFAYLATLPKDLQCFLEVRHPDWFTEPNQEELFQQLRKLHIGAVITDAPGRRDCCHMHLTIPKTFIRYVGNNMHKTDYKRLDQWVERLKHWQDAGLKEAYFIPHPGDESFGPEMSKYFIHELNKKCGAELTEIQL